MIYLMYLFKVKREPLLLTFFGSPYGKKMVKATYYSYVFGKFLLALHFHNQPPIFITQTCNFFSYSLYFSSI